MRWAFCIACALVGAAIPAAAHHSIAGVYDSSARMTLEAVVVEFQFVSPHPFVIVEAADANGRVRQWRLEMDNRFELTAVGVTAETLKKGDRIVVSGSAARDGSAAVYVRRLDRAADGFWYEQVGSSPRTSLRRR
jgi:hypothetical protein